GGAQKAAGKGTTEAREDAAASWDKAKAAAASARPPANTVYVGTGNLQTILGYFPKTLTVPVGTTVNFVNDSPQEPHTATFGPKKWIQGFQQKTDLFPQGPGKPNHTAPVFIY